MPPESLELDLGPLGRDSPPPLSPGAQILAGFATPQDACLLSAIRTVTEQAPFRHMETPGGKRMSVAMSNSGIAGWISDRKGYRYSPIDPQSKRPWPTMPAVFASLAAAAADAAGFPQFVPDACLINRYLPGTRMTLHQDQDELNFSHPIVSVSLGLPATFLWGGQIRASRPRRISLVHGDVVVWGGPARLLFHGVDTLKDGDHPLTGAIRFNLTFRKAH